MNTMLLSVAKRILKSFPSFIFISSMEQLYERVPFTEKKLCIDETVIGVYLVESSGDTDFVVITDRGIHVKFKEEYNGVAYSEIQSIEFQKSKCNVQGFNIVLKNDCLVWLPINGNNDQRFSDAFEFIRFLDRAREIIHGNYNGLDKQDQYKPGN